jgi:PAS domain S-box-containing protein
MVIPDPEDLPEKLSGLFHGISGNGSNDYRTKGAKKILQGFLRRKSCLEKQNKELTQALPGLKEIAADFIKLYECAPFACFTLTPEGIILEMNHAAVKLLQLNREEALNNKFADFLALNSVPAFLKFLKKLLNGKMQSSCELSLKQGVPLQRYLQVSGIFSEKLQRCLIMAADVTEIRLYSSLLEESEQRYRSLMDNLDAGIVIHAPDTSVITANVRATELLGIAPASISGLQASDRVWKFINPDYSDLPLADYPVNRILSTGKMIRNQVVGVCTEGLQMVTWLLVNGFPVRNAGKGISEVFISFTDISEQKYAEEALNRSQQRYREIFDNVQDVFYQTDLAGNILQVSPSIFGFTGFTNEELIGSQVNETYYEPTDRQVFLNLIMEKEEVHDFELRLKNRTGQLRYASMNARLVRDAEGNPHHVNGSLRDITARKHAEESLRMKMDELIRFQRVAVGRELAMIELKNEVNQLLSELGRKPKYRMPE